MHGKIHYISEIDIGSRFTFQIPCYLVDETAPASAAPSVASTPETDLSSAFTSTAATVPSYAVRVLVVEDTEINRQLERILLTRRGCIVEEAENGQLALEAIERQRYDLILMDCMMPVMDGFEASRRLREKEAATGAARMPVIALTASAIDGDRERCLAAGMDDFLAKPFTVSEFAAVVGRWVDLAPASRK